MRVFRAMIEDAGNGGAFVTIPFDVEQVFGKKRVRVRATLAGEPYRGTLVRMGGACHILGVLREIREKTGRTFGDEIEVMLEEDTEPREVAVPEDLRQALEGEPVAAEFFSMLSYTHQREHVEWIGEAKRDQTRRNRIDRTIKMLMQGVRGRSK
jgi:hypothetical protein